MPESMNAKMVQEVVKALGYSALVFHTETGIVTWGTPDLLHTFSIGNSLELSNMQLNGKLIFDGCMYLDHVQSFKFENTTVILGRNSKLRCGIKEAKAALNQIL